MTANYDETTEKYPNPTEASLGQAIMNEGTMHDDEFEDDAMAMMGTEPENAEGELTPNDIFGLDPLDVLTLEELAEYLKVPTATARRAVKEQDLPCRNIGGELRFLRDAVANWLRGQEAPAQKQQQERREFTKQSAPETEGDRYSRPPRRPYQSEQAGGSGGGEYRPRQRYPDQSYGQSGTGQSGSGQYGGGYGGSGGGYSRPPRQPFRSTQGNNQGNYGGAAERSDEGGYTGGGAQGNQFGGGGYGGGGQRFGGGPKRKNKRQVFDNERAKRLDRRKQDDGPEGQQ